MTKMCIGTEEAVAWFKSLPAVGDPKVLESWTIYTDLQEVHERALTRLDWLADRVRPVKPVVYTGKFNSYACGACRGMLEEATDKYCSRCGREIDWRQRDGD